MRVFCGWCVFCVVPLTCRRWGDTLLRSMLFDRRISSKVEYSSGSVLLEYGLSAKKAEDVTVSCVRVHEVPQQIHIGNAATRA